MCVQFPSSCVLLPLCLFSILQKGGLYIISLGHTGDGKHTDEL